MPASRNRFGAIDRRERMSAFAAVALVQVGLALILLSGLRVSVLRPGELISQLIQVTLPKVPPPPPPVVRMSPKEAIAQGRRGRAQGRPGATRRLARTGATARLAIGYSGGCDPA